MFFFIIKHIVSNYNEEQKLLQKWWLKSSKKYTKDSIDGYVYVEK